MNPTFSAIACCEFDVEEMKQGVRVHLVVVNGLSATGGLEHFC